MYSPWVFYVQAAGDTGAFSGPVSPVDAMATVQGCGAPSNGLVSRDTLNLLVNPTLPVDAMAFCARYLKKKFFTLSLKKTHTPRIVHSHKKVFRR